MNLVLLLRKLRQRLIDLPWATQFCKCLRKDLNSGLPESRPNALSTVAPSYQQEKPEAECCHIMNELSPRKR